MRYLIVLLFIPLAGCGLNPFDRSGRDDPAPAPPVIEDVEETEISDGDVPEENSVEAQPQVDLGEGTTVAGLGDPTRPGLWMETPLVGGETKGRVTNPGNGKWVRMTLLPSGGAPGSGSRLSPQAMQALDVPLTELVTVQVTPGG